ncbi:MAG: hypothetical protein PIR53_14565 [Nocardioides alkalitolerans]
MSTTVVERPQDRQRPGPDPVAIRRVAAGGALLAAAGHLGVAAVAPGAGTLVMLLMAAACLPCALHLWTHGDRRTWWTLGACAGLMVLVHSVLMAGHAHGGHDPAAVGAGAATAHALMWALTWLETAVAAVCLVAPAADAGTTTSTRSTTWETS